MSKITIQDLSDSVELDRAAMSSILGGARTSRGRLEQLHRQQTAAGPSTRLLDLARRKRMAHR